MDVRSDSAEEWLHWNDESEQWRGLLLHGRMGTRLERQIPVEDAILLEAVAALHPSPRPMNSLSQPASATDGHQQPHLQPQLQEEQSAIDAPIAVASSYRPPFTLGAHPPRAFQQRIPKPKRAALPAASTKVPGASERLLKLPKAPDPKPIQRGKLDSKPLNEEQWGGLVTRLYDRALEAQAAKAKKRAARVEPEQIGMKIDRERLQKMPQRLCTDHLEQKAKKKQQREEKWERERREASRKMTPEEFAAFVEKMYTTQMKKDFECQQRLLKKFVLEETELKQPPVVSRKQLNEIQRRLYEEGVEKSIQRHENLSGKYLAPLVETKYRHPDQISASTQQLFLGKRAVED
eukprot:NODE_2233_length_1257_cov_22.028974_g2034_i0.p1 GENE.NODE_2233_length_1257_cov_22.028974_g2034_i0~~NODE_2233_length_1257_cov_22.028974_g2034_i0.p1  ORF type:complete len:372 (+),score=79.43 NODE_2233_length_1257_cov_22.028974_g2034_i0:71-1117(+)